MKLYIVGLIVSILIGSISCSAPQKQEQTSEKQSSQKEMSTTESKDQIILFFGNSITAGYGLDPEDAFPAAIQDILDSLNYPYQVVNAGLSGETTAGGLNRIEWVLQTVPDIFVLELGANDGLRGLDLTATHKNLIAIVEKVKAVNPDVEVIIAGMEVPPNLGPDYTKEFRQIFPAVAKETQSDLIPFILEKVAGEPALNQNDGIHPTAEGHELVAQTVWTYLQPHLQKEAL